MASPVRILLARAEGLWVPVCGGTSGLSNDDTASQKMSLGCGLGSDSTTEYNGHVVADMTLGK